jgi:hypothetical protein
MRACWPVELFWPIVTSSIDRGFIVAAIPGLSVQIFPSAVPDWVSDSRPVLAAHTRGPAVLMSDSAGQAECSLPVLTNS